MRIEINSGGLGALAIGEYQSNLSSFLSDAESVILSFKTVEKATYELNGGVGTLQNAVGDISARILHEENRLEAATEIQKKSDNFLNLAIRVDAQVSALVNKNKDEFYRVHPWLRPPGDVSVEAPLYEKAWSWLCGKGEAIVGNLKTAWEWAKDTAKKAWDGIVTFYNEHKKIIDTILIVVGAIVAIAAVIATSGLALVPLLASIGIPAGVATAFSMTVAVVAVVSTFFGSALNIIDVWAEIDNPTFNAWQKGLNITSAVFNMFYSIGGLYNQINGVSPSELKTFRSQGYSSEEIRLAVKQDACIKRFPEELAKADNKNLVKGNYGEMMQDKQMRISGYKRISSSTVSDYKTPLGHGIDGVYSNGTSYVIGDAKYGTATLQLTKDGMQMSPAWIESRLDSAVGFDVSQRIIEQGYTSQVFHISDTNPKIFWIEYL